MKITPIEIRQKDFQKAFRGYEKEEVDAFLLSLSQEWERVMDENKDIRRKLEIAEKEVNRLREVESSLFRTLKTAEDTGAHMIDHANKTAELHMREAQMKAEAMLNEAKSRAKNMIEEAEEKAKELLDDMQEEARNLQKDYQYILNQRDNMLQDLKNIVNDTLEKVNRNLSRTKGIEEKIKEIKSFNHDKLNIFPEEKETFKNPSSGDEEKKNSSGNFFDTL